MSSTTHQTPNSGSHSHLDRKSLRRADAFTVAVTGFFNRLGQNTSVLIVGLAILFVFGLGAAYWMNHLEARAQAASNALYLAEKAEEAELKALAAKYVKPEPKTDSKPVDAKTKASSAPDESADQAEYQKLDVDSQFSGAIAKLTGVAVQFPSTRPGFEAHLKLGTLYFDHGDSAKALSWFEKAEKVAGSGFDRAVALTSVGYANENLGKPAEAVVAFQKALHLGETSLKGDLLLALGRCYEALHDTAKARSIYDQTLSELPGTDEAKNAELRKSRL